ncbi:hypothetical protein [Streptomyces sp. BE133]|uniref:hypothetical protein n=1 Tax=Streptomyces sp. BE133 TaxID=3002523 RepID=UPI002E787D31|nr:hypothetical protein [Streptomyces sp. BE133]MEE1810269.1 hypothetical protein [Streptomyces sp. BE133]
MSNNDQQHPYGQDPGYGYDPLNGQEPQPAQPYGQQQPPQPYGEQAYGDRSSGAQSYGNQSYADQSYGGESYGQQPHGGESYGQQPHGGESYGQQSYGGESYGQQAPYGAPQQAHGPYDPNRAARANPGPAWPAGHMQEPATPAGHGPQDPGVTQTWEGQTWDTQYQPAIRPAQPAQPVQQPVPATAETGYLPPHPQPQAASGSYPLPPEAPVAPVAAEPVRAAAPADAAPAATGSAHDAAGYSAPTTLGNSRITDAQRARAEGRSPIIAPGMQPAGITAGLGLLLALGAAIGPYALVVPLVLLQAVTAAGWFRLNGMWPARQGIALAFAGGFVADIALLAAGRENGPAAILGTLGIWVLLTVVLQLRSHASADERMQGLMATVASAALSVLAAGHLAAVPDAVTVGGVAVAVAVLVRALPLPGPASVVVALLAAAGAGAVAGAFTDFGTKGALLGLAAGGCALIGLRVASYDYPSRFVHMTAGVALPLTAAAPAVYLIGRAIS